MSLGEGESKAQKRMEDEGRLGEKEQQKMGEVLVPCKKEQE
jgi:hypothetical protein